MAYTLDTVVPAGTAGLTDLRAQLYDTAGSNVGSAITTGFVDLGTGFYHWHYAAFPDAHRGGVKFYSAAASSVILSAVAINPEEGEYADAKTSTRSTYAGGAVASVTAPVTVGANNDKTGYALSSAGIQAIWDALTSALTTVGSVGKLLVDNINATISSRLATSGYTAPDNATVATINTKLGTPAGGSVSADIAIVAGYIDTEVTAIKAKTDNLPASPAAAGDIPSAATNANTLLTSVLESGKTVAQAILDLWAKEVGRATANSADSPTSITYRSPDDTVQITHTHDGTTRAVS